MTFSSTDFRVFFFKTFFWAAVILLSPLQLQASDSPKNLVLPDSLGEISERFLGKAQDGWILVIRNGSADPGVQENIAAVIDYLNERYGLNQVLIEGEASRTSLPESWGLPNIREKNMLARFLLEQQRINAAVYAALFSKTPVFLAGGEDPVIYADARKVLSRLKSKEDFIKKNLNAFEASLEKRKKKELNGDLYNLDAALSLFYEDQNTEEFLMKLSDLPEKAQMDMTDFVQLPIAKKAYTLRSSIRKANFRSEVKRLQKAYKKRFSSFEEIVESGELTEERLEHYPHVLRYIQWLDLKGQIQLKQLQDELDKAIEQLIIGNSRSPEEESLMRALVDYYHSRRMLLLKALPEDQKYWESFKKGIFRSDFEPGHWKEIFAFCEQFYSAGQKRGLRFTQSVLSGRNKSTHLAVLTSSFLSSQLLAVLRQEGISYLYITPAQADHKETPGILPYEKSPNTIPFEDQPVLPESRYAIAKTDDAFFEALRILMRTRSLYAARDYFDQAASDKA